MAVSACCQACTAQALVSATVPPAWQAAPAWAWAWAAHSSTTRPIAGLASQGDGYVLLKGFIPCLYHRARARPGSARHFRLMVVFTPWETVLSSNHRAVTVLVCV
ncbi:hypothetical protein Acidovoranil_15060 [Acidovorax sp. FG27]